MFKIAKSNRQYLLGTLVLPALLSGCLDQNFAIKSVAPALRTPATSGTPVPTAGTTTQTAITFRSLQPALAVRGASCLMCHAQVSSNVISDFGAGNDYFFDKDKGGVGFYSDYYIGSLTEGMSSWGSAVIRGSLFVPKTNMGHSFPLVDAVDPLKAKTTMTLAEVISSPRRYSDGRVSAAGMSTGVSPVGNAAAVIDRKTVYIGAPTESEILALAPDLTSTGFKAVSVTGITPDPLLPLSGLQVVTSSAGSYVTNSSSQPFICAGDVVVRGTLFLNTINVKTNNQGCRLYVSGSVFIQGPVTYSGTSLTTANLQITSARMIAMGFDLANLQDRLGLVGGRSFTLGMFTTRSPLSPAVRHQAQAAEAAMLTGLVDAGPESTDNAKPAFNGLLLNAPEVHSRYVGNFKGAVVAEIAMFRLGNFVFTFDPTFQTVPILPALKSDILSFTD